MDTESMDSQKTYDGRGGAIVFGLATSFIAVEIVGFVIALWHRHGFRFGDYESPAFMFVAWLACYEIRKFVHKCAARGTMRPEIGGRIASLASTSLLFSSMAMLEISKVLF